MADLNTTAYTPSTINSIKFRIPLYQRPYAWGVQQVDQLLKDLLIQYKKESNQHYFIGILNVGTTESNELYDLIDGQQRITTLYLIGRVLSKEYSKWNEFLNNRIDLYGRKEDQQYLEKTEISINPNPKMIEAVEVIKKFLKEPETAGQGFAKFVFDHAAFFISLVPAHYTIIEKNLQFVRMNNRGKQLESHDVLKIKLAAEITITDVTKRNDFITRWNKISQLGCGDSNSTIAQEKSLESLLNEGIPAGLTEKDLEKDSEIFYESIVTFPEFLLIALARFFKKENTHLKVSHHKEKQSNEYRKDRLLEEFGFGETEIAFIWNEERVGRFIDLLESQFNIFDKFIIKRDKEDKYKFKWDSKDNLVGSSLLELQVFQSFLYVTREPNQNNWLIDTFDFVEQNLNGAIIETLFYLNFLKDLDNERCRERDSSSFTYGSIDRYWFWRLDYYLWENRDVNFKEKSLGIANKYVFRVNRSIEHIAPQTPNSKVYINVELMDLFGNLAMISSGQNSSLQNQSFEIKHAHVEAYINGSKSGTIESLKMLDIYSPENRIWDEETLKIHSNKMIKALIDSFPLDYSDITNNLKEHIFHREETLGLVN